MTNTTWMLGVLVGGGLLLGNKGLQAQDWPQWRGPNRDARVTGFTAPQSWPKELTQKWKVTVGDGVATPALVGDKLYVFSRQSGNEIIRCLETATGKELWQEKYKAQGATGPAGGFAGPRASPTVAEGKVVTLGVCGVLSCLDAETGKVLWRKDDFKGSWPRFFTSSSPIVVDGLCVAQLGGENNGGVVAYDLASGEQKWKWTGDGTAYASPVLLTLDGVKVIVAETDRNIVALTLQEGQLLWQTPYLAPRGARAYNASTPIIEGQTVVYSGGGRGTKAIKLEKQREGLGWRELWSNRENSVQFNTPVVKGGLVFGITSNDQLFCINAETGKTAWTAAYPSRGRQRGYGSIVDAGSVLIALNPSGQLLVFEPTDKQFKQIASYKVSDDETFAYPVLSGNRLFVKDRESLILWTIE